MKKICVFMIFSVAILCSSCQGGREKATSSLLEADSTYYAQGYKIKHYADYITIDIKDPWKGDSGALLQRYILIDRNKDIPKELPEGTIVKIPIKKVIVYMSVQCSIIEKLGIADEIVGVCAPQYIDSKEIKRGVEEGRIANLGEASSPNIEKMINLNAEAILASPFENCGYGAAEKIGIPIIEFADYMESKPLARTEWVRFYGLLFGKQDRADSIFTSTCERYDSLKSLTANVKYRPTLMAERKYGSSWFVPSGESYMATIYKDAGADYLFSSVPGSGSTPKSVESVLETAINADYWVFKCNLKGDMSYEMLSEESPYYREFEPYKKRRIYSCNTGETPYYDVVTMNPDAILENLIWVFHPYLLPDYRPKYFFPLK